MVRKKMLAAVLYGPKDIRIEKIPIPKIGEEEVLIKVKYCGICPSDIKDYLGIRSRIRKNKQIKPVILGHEFSGEVVKAGEKVKNIAPHVYIGMRAVARIFLTCGKCIFCQNGIQNMCPDKMGLGNINNPGAFAEYIKVPSMIVKNSIGICEIPQSVDYKEACFEEPVAACLNGILQTKIKIGDPVIIFGGGPIGLILVQLARLVGGMPIVLIEPIQERRELALKLGADYAIDPTKKDIIQESMHLTNNLGSCLTIVATSVPHVIPTALKITRRNSQLLLFAGFPEGTDSNLDPNIIHYRQIHVLGSAGSTISMRNRSLNLITKKRIEVSSLISDMISIERIEKGFELILKSKRLKILVKY